MAIGAVILVIIFQVSKERPTLKLDSCLHCHQNVTNPDPSHITGAIGCQVCHLGNPYAYEKETSHLGMVKNPGDLRHVHLTCGRAGCHREMVTRVKGSVMATNRGMLKRLEVLWTPFPDYVSGPKEVLDFMGNHPEIPGQYEYFAKMCGACHLWKEIGDVEGEIGKRGGGCSACHVVSRTKKTEDLGTIKEYIHPKMSLKVPNENCLRCHNRSHRIGLSYKGMFESEGYGTPFQGKGLSQRLISKGRYYLDLPPDIHYQKAGLWCIDCHTSTEVMGDGKVYSELREQLEVDCKDCHAPRFIVAKDIETALKLNKSIPQDPNLPVPVSKKGTKLYNIKLIEGKAYLFRKSDGHPFELTFIKNEPYHTLKGHERLSCQACHSQWIPQCYGCHIKKEKNGLQWNWLQKKATKGIWTEKREFMRFSNPLLSLRYGVIYPSYPHPVTYYKDSRAFTRNYLISFDPHTTSKQSRLCFYCHSKTQAVGNAYIGGEASFLIKNLPYDIEQNYEPLYSVMPLRPEDQKRLFFVGNCIPCHQSYHDPIYKDFQVSLQTFYEKGDLPCKK